MYYLIFYYIFKEYVLKRALKIEVRVLYMEDKHSTINVYL